MSSSAVHRPAAVRFWDEALETMPWPTVQAWQAGRVADFVEGLRHRAPLYTSLLNSAPRPARSTATFDFLADLPFTTREDLARSAEAGRPGEPLGGHQGVAYSRIVQTVSSAAAQGRPAAYSGLTVADLEAWRDGVACVLWTAGIGPGDVVAHLDALPGGSGGLPYADGFRQVGATLAWLGGQPPAAMIEAIPRLGINAVLACGESGRVLTEHCRTAGGPAPSDLGVRKLLAEGGCHDGSGDGAGWGVTHLREIMGAEAVLPALWAECEQASGMHFCGQRHVAVELVEPAGGGGVPWEEGACGEVVYTTFDRQATPVLRLRSAEFVAVTGAAGTCPCGRTSPRVRRLTNPAPSSAISRN